VSRLSGQSADLVSAFAGPLASLPAAPALTRPGLFNKVHGSADLMISLRARNKYG
jgi:hypothetical protein